MMNSLKNTPADEISAVMAAQREFFATGATLDIEFRRNMLRRLDAALHDFEPQLCEALRTDLHKSHEEAWLTEFGILYREIKLHLRKLRSWARSRRAHTPLMMFPSRSRTMWEPLGAALIIAPWNYPVQLLINPLVGAISAGCTAMLKPSPYTPRVSALLAEMIAAAFEPRYIALAQGNREVNTALLAERFDIIFFTGSPALGRTVMRAAAENLTPVVLELGGKSPCIVDAGADTEVAARRIAWGKTLNAGQTCIAPDYLLVHSSVKDSFTRAFEAALREMHGDDMRTAPHYGRMVNLKAFDRVAGYMNEGRTVTGGGSVRDELYIEPTIIEGVADDAAVMREEIFGPVFPLRTFDDSEEVVRFINGREKPLALYYFGPTERGREIVRRTSSGGACINDTIMHVVNDGIPFGGVGNSGMGSYHGRRTFEAFSHLKSVVETPLHPDLPFRYAPYSLFGWAKRFF